MPNPSNPLAANTTVRVRMSTCQALRALAKAATVERGRRVYLDEVICDLLGRKKSREKDGTR